jgi:hypothetical protein
MSPQKPNYAGVFSDIKLQSKVVDRGTLEDKRYKGDKGDKGDKGER